MDRLTMKTPNGYESINPIDLCLDEYSDINFEKILDKLGEYEDYEEIFRKRMTEDACDFLKDKEEFAKWLDRNKWIVKKCDEYARAEEQGLLLRLPCKVGDVVYEVQELRKRIQPMEITGVKINRLGGIYFEWELYLGIGVYHSMNGMKIDDIGKRVFLTREEAEAKLAELRGTENG